VAETLFFFFFFKSVNDFSAHKAMCYILKTNNDIYKHTETLNGFLYLHCIITKPFYYGKCLLNLTKRCTFKTCVSLKFMKLMLNMVKMKYVQEQVAI